jgi:hypothetical protein
MLVKLMKVTKSLLKTAVFYDMTPFDGWMGTSDPEETASSLLMV